MALRTGTWKHRVRGERVAVFLAALWMAPGCNAGSGEGWVTGKLWIENCRDGQPLGMSPIKPADFDLGVDFFAGETHEDSNQSVSQRRNGLTIRLQDTSNWLEDANGMILQLLDVRQAATLFAAGAPVPVTDNVGCSGSACGSWQDLIRARLYLYTVCPNCKQPMVASSHEIKLASSTTGSPAGATCLQSTGTLRPACPTLSDAQKQALGGLCQGSFTDLTVAEQVKELLEGNGGTCLYLCRLGEAARGQTLEDLAGFRIEYGDVVAGIFSMAILDGRALQQTGCAKAAGTVQGMFSFEVTRNRVAQSFP